MEMQDPSIVQEFMIENTRLKISDEYCRDMTSEQVRHVLDELAKKLQRYYSATGT